jgi:predicted TIM-barrel fold metal-dependent hydrolase
MKIDAWTHFLTPAYLRHLEEQGADAPRIGAFLLANRALHDLEFRFNVMDAFDEYRQVLAPIPGPHIHSPGDGRPGAIDDLIRRNNDEMAETVARHPSRFAGFAAATPIADPDAAAAEAVRAVRSLGALGVQLEEDASEFPLHDSRYDPLFASMADLGAAVWLHPFRTPASPGYPKEAAPFLLWQVFGWLYDTTITVSRLVLAGVFDRHPALKLIVHHGGAMIPHVSGRIERIPFFTKLDPALREALAPLRKAPVEYFKMLYVDTALFGCPHAVKSVLEFFGPEQVLFGTDTPFDTEGGAHFIPATVSDIESAAPGAPVRSNIFQGNARRVLNIR